MPLDCYGPNAGKHLEKLEAERLATEADPSRLEEAYEDRWLTFRRWSSHPEVVVRRSSTEHIARTWDQHRSLEEAHELLEAATSSGDLGYKLEGIYLGYSVRQGIRRQQKLFVGPKVSWPSTVDEIREVFGRKKLLFRRKIRGNRPQPQPTRTYDEAYQAMVWRCLDLGLGPEQVAKLPTYDGAGWWHFTIIADGFKHSLGWPEKGNLFVGGFSGNNVGPLRSADITLADPGESRRKRHKLDILRLGFDPLLPLARWAPEELEELRLSVRAEYAAGFDRVAAAAEQVHAWGCYRRDAYAMKHGEEARRRDMPTQEEREADNAAWDKRMTEAVATLVKLGFPSNEAHDLAWRGLERVERLIASGQLEALTETLRRSS